MAQRQVKPPERTEGERVIEQLQEAMEAIRRGGFSEPQRQTIRQFLEQMTQLMQQMQTTQPATPTQSSPQTRTAPAPRRVQQFVYDVSLGGRTYRVAMADQLPAGPAGQRRLHDLLLNNQLVRRENPNDPASPLLVLAQVTMPGTSQADQRFNAGVPNQRLDQFRDAYLGLTFHDGHYVQSTAVRIAEVPQTGASRRM